MWSCFSFSTVRTRVVFSDCLWTWFRCGACRTATWSAVSGRRRRQHSQDLFDILTASKASESLQMLIERLCSSFISICTVFYFLYISWIVFDLKQEKADYIHQSDMRSDEINVCSILNQRLGQMRGEKKYMNICGRTEFCFTSSVRTHKQNSVP